MLGRLIAWLLVALAALAFIYEVIRAVMGGAYELIALGELWFTLDPASLNGLQAGVQKKSQVILFMTHEALKKFQNSRGWKVGVDGSVALVKLGVDGSIDSQTLKESVVGFVFSNIGLMYNLTLEGSKITRIAR